MEMDWGTAIVGIIVLSLFAIPFVLDHRSRSEKEKLLLRPLRGIAHQHGCNVDRHESCGLAALGLDERRNALFFFSRRAEVVTTQYVDLAGIRSCQAVKATRTTKGQQGEVVLERIGLSLVPKDKNKPETHFELYRAGMNVNLNGEVEFVDKWARLINERLKGG